MADIQTIVSEAIHLSEVEIFIASIVALDAGLRGNAGWRLRGNCRTRK